ncbi:MAG: tRNA (N(6)-L-threonylcarbamoyladenosine(37)-C(2))-methylthiotransferase MtaB [Cyclobacteriaceae bacterium]|nr:tRNA (N(6)-L-threonylcarbamoyladenosine(37)-C(2))-methylthiotransferase MtaB [Cyclobacteriaceae bacterium]
MKKVAFYTLGCKLNFSETSTISRKFEENGYRKVDFTDAPDIFIINTCSVTENVDKKYHKIVREARAISPNAYVAIIGCYSQLKPKEISEIPGVDAVLGASEKFRLVELLDGFVRPPQPIVISSDISEASTFTTSYSMNDRTRTFLKVQDGCDYSCSFCTIPLARGGSRSDSIENILKTAEEIARTEVKEIVLTGVNTGDFGIQNGIRVERFIQLVQALDKVSGIERFRISSIEPNLLSNDIIEFVATSNRFAPHFHIPLQSGSDKILKLMRRRYQRQLYTERVNKIKTVMPHACIGVDVIVGFPGETHEDFLETYNFLNELNISYLHVFTYSEREKTLAVNLSGIVPMKDRSERSRMLHILSEKKKRVFYEENVNSEHMVIFENDIEDGMMHGFTENYVRVAIPYDPMMVREIQRVKITSINEKGVALGEEVLASAHA